MRALRITKPESSAASDCANARTPAKIRITIRKKFRIRNLSFARIPPTPVEKSDFIMHAPFEDLLSAIADRFALQPRSRTGRAWRARPEFPLGSDRVRPHRTDEARGMGSPGTHPGKLRR